MKRRCINADEYDLLYGRRHYCYLQRAGATSWIKRKMRRRERREGKQEIRRELRDV
jgi:hypothetical protein